MDKKGRLAGAPPRLLLLDRVDEIDGLEGARRAALGNRPDLRFGRLGCDRQPRRQAMPVQLVRPHQQVDSVNLDETAQ
ncbi:hypothetical protein EV128_10411 [Rhizobium azibense]|nr:hypothetical protein EV128_10411 [Rhizobium azibense]